MPIRIWRSVLALGLLLSATAAAENNKKNELEAVRDEIAGVQADLSAREKDRETLQKQLRDISLEISENQKKLRQLEQQIAIQDARIEELQSQQDTATEQQQAELEALYEQLRAAYINAQPGYLKMLLNQQSPTELMRFNEYYRYFHAARRQQIEAINDKLAAISEEQKALYQAQKKLDELYQSQQETQQQLKSRTSAREQTMAQLNQQIQSQRERLGDLQQQEKDLQALIESLRRKAEKTPPKSAPMKPSQPFASLTGKLPWPVEGRIIADYGSSRNVGKLSWKGILINSKVGQDVQATAGGNIVFSDWMRGFGLLLIIDHGDGYMTLYGNNDSLLKSTGESVQSGEIVARSGSQGVKQTAGVYFEIRHQGQPADPKKWLQ